MSILSHLTGIHIGLGPKKVHFATPDEIAQNPDASAAFQHTQDQVNGAIGQANTLNKGALVAGGALVGGGLLGVGPMAGGGAATAGTAAGGSAVPIGAGSAASAAGAAGAGSSIWDTIKNAGGSVLSGAENLLGKANDATGGGSGLNKILLAAAIADAAATRKRQQDLQNQGLAYATDSYSARQPLRHQGLSMLQSQQTPDTSWVNNPANPYSRNPTPFNVSAKTPILPSKGTY